MTPYSSMASYERSSTKSLLLLCQSMSSLEFEVEQLLAESKRRHAQERDNHHGLGFDDTSGTGEYFWGRSPSLPANDLDIFDAKEVITQSQEYAMAGSSMMHPFDPNPYMLGPPTVQYTSPQPAVIDELQPMVPAYPSPYPNVQGTFNIRDSLIFGDEPPSAIFPANDAAGLAEFPYPYPNQSYPSNSSLCHQEGPSNFTAAEYHYPPSTSEPVASSPRRQTLADVQPGFYHGEVDFPTLGDESEAENDSFVLDLPLERRQRQSRSCRQQPYDRRKGGTCRTIKAATATIVPSNFDPSSAIATFLTCQALICPILIRGVACGQLVNTAQEMRDHLEASHTVNSKKEKGANAGLGGVCPHCNTRVSSCVYRHMMSDFYRYACPVEGCGITRSRPDQLRKHCKSHGFCIGNKANEQYAVRKV